jgi:nucleotide-binding universal stress UspA family protein
MAAADESDAGRQAIWTARAFASQAGARVTVLRVLPLDDRDTPPAVDQLRRWVEADLPPLDPTPAMTYALAYGLPGIEITRVAEQQQADLLVVGRKQRSRMARLLLGDTADAVARRSRVPCLFVPPRRQGVRRFLVEVEGSERGTIVQKLADNLAREVGAELRLVTVEPVYAGEPVGLAAALPATRSTRVQARVRDTLGRELEVRRGEPADQILQAAQETDPDVLVLGCHRGGPAGLIEGGSTARHVIHAAPCAVLTVPL